LLRIEWRRASPDQKIGLGKRKSALRASGNLIRLSSFGPEFGLVYNF